MNFRSLLAPLFSFGGPPKLHVWQRFEPLGKGLAGTMSQFFKVREKETGNIYGLKLPDIAKLAPIEARFKGLKKPSEGEISLQIRGDHVVTTHECGLTHDGGQYILQEFLEGVLVHLRLKRDEPLSLDERISIIRQLAAGVQTVHQAGFVHRDICPRNLMIDDSGRVTLFDFGLTVPDSPPSSDQAIGAGRQTICRLRLSAAASLIVGSTSFRLACLPTKSAVGFSPGQEEMPVPRWPMTHQPLIFASGQQKSPTNWLIRSWSASGLNQMTGLSRWRSFCGKLPVSPERQALQRSGRPLHLGFRRKAVGLLRRPLHGQSASEELLP